MKKADLVAYIAGELSEEENSAIEKELEANPQYIEELTDICKDQLLLTEYFDENISVSTKKKIRTTKTIRVSSKKKKTKSPIQLFLAAAAIVLFGIFISVLSNQEAPIIANITKASQTVSVVRNDKNFSLSKDDSILQGDLVYSEGEFEISYPDGSVLKLEQDTSLVLEREDNGGKTINLKNGEFLADITPQNNKLKIYTKQAELTVLGTVFTVSALEDKTSLQVSEGKVRFGKLKASAYFVDVEAGNSASIKEGEGIRFEQAFLEDFRDRNQLYARWENLKNPFPISFEKSAMHIDVKNLPNQAYGDGGWAGNGGTGIKTKQSFILPFSVELDFESTSSDHRNLLSIVQFESTSQEKSFWIGRRGATVQAKWSYNNKLIFSKTIKYSGKERWSIQCSNKEVVVKLNGQEVFRNKLEVDLSDKYKVSILTDAKRNFPEETSVSFSNVKINSIK